MFLPSGRRKCSPSILLLSLESEQLLVWCYINGSWFVSVTGRLGKQQLVEADQPESFKSPCCCLSSKATSLIPQTHCYCGIWKRTGVTGQIPADLHRMGHLVQQIIKIFLLHFLLSFYSANVLITLIIKYLSKYLNYLNKQSDSLRPCKAVNPESMLLPPLSPSCYHFSF